MEEHHDDAAMAPLTEETGKVQDAGAEMAAAPQTEGRRTQLRVLREGVEDLRTDVWKLTRNHESSSKKVEQHLAALRKDLSAHSRSTEVSDMLKAHSATQKKLERQVASLTKQLDALKGNLAKEAAASRKREDASLARILAKVTPKKSAAKKARKR